jgi:hypothetical protein
VGWNWGLGNTQQEDDMKEQEEEQEKQKELYEYMENVLP